LLQPFIGGIAAGNPQNLGWRTISFEQQQKVSVLRHDDCRRRPRRLEYFLILRIS
jgi:hypothetical protein